MISTTYASTPVLLANDPPDWTGRVSLTLDALTQFDEGLTGREARRPHAATLRAKIRYQTTVDGTDAIVLQALLRTYQAQPVLVPAWPLGSLWQDRAGIATTGGIRVAYKADWSQWELYEGTEPTWPDAEDYVAPVLWGRLDSRDVAWVNASTVRFEVEFTEAGPTSYALAPSAVSFPAGPTLAGYGTAPRLWPLGIDWREVPEAFAFRVLREQLGFGRAPQETTYPATPQRETTLRTLTTRPAEVWSLIRFFLDHGHGATFWTPTWRAAALMSANLGAGSTSLSVVSSAGITGGDRLAFVQGVGVVATARASAVSGGTVTLEAAPGAMDRNDTVVSPLILARFERPRLELSFASWDVAEASAPVVECPPEYAPASDETLGTTIGILPTRAYVYDLTQTIGGVTTTTRLTSYERDITLSGNTYTARKMDHGQIRGSLFLDRDEVDVRTEVVPGDPFVRLATGQSEAPLRVTVRAVDVSGGTASNAAVLFTGEVLSATVRGSRITAKLVSAGTVFDRTFPRFRLQTGCNHALFSVGCGLALADWRFTGNINGTPTPGFPFAMPVNNLTRTIGSMPTITAGWFSGGWVEFGTGAATVRRAIIGSTAASGGALTLTLSRDPAPFPVAGAAVALYPGCDGAKETCAGKFANFLNFGGHPFVPLANPSLMKISQNLGGGKK